MSDINKNQSTNPGELYSNFDSSEVDQYADEAKARWGNTEMYKQSQERVKKMSKADMARIKKAGEDLTQEIAELMPLGPTHASVQKLIDQHYNALRTFYEPNLELYRGLANMYVADPRFTAYYEKYAKGLAQFMTAAMNHYVDVKEGKN